MVEASDEPSLLHRHRSNVNVSRLNPAKPGATPALPVIEEKSHSNDAVPVSEPTESSDGKGDSNLSEQRANADAIAPLPPPAPPPAADEADGSTPATVEGEAKPNIAIRFYHTAKEILLSSYFNLLLAFVPAAIAVGALGINPIVVFALNAVAIVPLASLLAQATEVVASRLGDTVGALLNVTFGNAVELIIFIALAKNEIQIVQAALVGSILSNLLLILGMCFFFGGMRYREQLYNCAVTQMSSCLLSLCVISLLLPTAFHASFSNDSSVEATVAVVAISRGTSVILLLIYVLYLIFQLKSHAYMYASTPQHVIDEESHPGVLAEILHSSSSSDSSSLSDKDSSDSSGSQTTAKRLKRAFRGRRRRKSSASSKDSPPMLSRAPTPSDLTFSDAMRTPSDATGPRHLTAVVSGDEADDDGIGSHRRRKRASKKKSKRRKAKHAADPKTEEAIVRSEAEGKMKSTEPVNTEKSPFAEPAKSIRDEREPLSKSPRVAFAEARLQTEISPRRPFNIRTLSQVPAMPRMLGPTVFSSANVTGAITATHPTIVPAPYGLRRTSSLPDRLNRHQATPTPHQDPTVSGDNQSTHSRRSVSSEKPKQDISRVSAIVLLLVSTALVALCAEFLVGSINYMVDHTDVSQLFIGLILLPIVGNAAEHVTAVTVAVKNKMDLAIGIAVGSSIQIALFVTPVIVLLGWGLGINMSLYFNLFETVSVFASAFIVNFLVLDGRSNYLEGALLISVYAIIALVAFFYPDASQQSIVGGTGGPSES